MLAEGYAHSTVLAKRSVLVHCPEQARVNGWLRGVDPVDAVPAPIKRERQDRTDLEAASLRGDAG